MGLSIGGLGSGLDTQTIISQLMQAEGIPQSTLKSQLSVNSVKKGAWASLGTIVSSLQSAADTLKTPDLLRSTTATTNASTQVQVSTSGSAAAGSVTFRVNRLATAQQLTSAGIASPTTVVGRSSTVLTSGSDAVGATSVTAGASAVTGKHTVVVTGTGADLRVTADGSPATLTTADNGDTSLVLADGTTVAFAGAPRAGTLSIGLAVTSSDTSTMSDLANALATAGGPARAALVETGDGSAAPLRMVLTATGTGTSGALKVTSTVPALDTVTVLRAPADAEVVLGAAADGSGGITVRRSSNTFSDLLPGATISLTKADPTVDVTVGVSSDDDASVKKVQAFVDGLNATLGWIKTNTAYDIAKQSGGPMVGDSGVRDLGGALVSAMQTLPPSGSLRVPGQIGITLQRDGTYKLDEAALRTAMKADPDAVAGLTSTLTSAVAGVTKAATATGGTIDTGKASTTANATALQTRIDDWDTKLKNIQTRYEKQFTALDVAMRQMNAQLSSLQSQIANLPTASG